MHLKYTVLFLLLPCVILTNHAHAQCPPFEVTPEWLAQIEAIAPAKPLVAPKEPRKVLICSLMTGFKHWCTPHTAAMLKILGDKSGAYEVVFSNDLANFEADTIKQYDVIVLNNTCSKNPDRHLFYDVLQDMEKAIELENNLINHIANGHGLAAFHGGIVAFNKSKPFSEMMGGSFHYHPKQQTVTGLIVDESHPITSAFHGEPLVHFDEPYYFNNAYFDYNFRPLLKMQLDPDGPVDKRQKPSDASIKRYISWIKPHGNGRVFYCSPSHNAQSFEQPKLLQFILNGMQYAAGDLDCNDTPLTEN
ncbi:ThuA domain-containing protein [Rubellicoccus peritrichatus]|uniref:ThuA domain-containing protein n=1 Tax=Rubellicoccus peritrichatus TaxID=3080537 RepID=A0AAQ3LFX3_9BACT|nr:ThuA domain-containing protein [Puniceicoccus sp. CR14]WOO41359.1 ThuA domain-containing protein [Puniceicoccus sp. CR14]